MKSKENQSITDTKLEENCEKIKKTTRNEKKNQSRVNQHNNASESAQFDRP